MKTYIDADSSTWEVLTVDAPLLPVGTKMRLPKFGSGVVVSARVRVHEDASVASDAGFSVSQTVVVKAEL